MAKVSVIVPIYNAEKYLAQCIDSLIHQTHRDLQILLINDGSTDSSLSIAQDFAQRDSRIEIHTQHNQGQGVARNNGMKYATGEWIAFVDADDYIAPDLYFDILPLADNVDVVMHGYQRVSSTGKLISLHVPQNYLKDTTPWVRIFRREWLQKHAITFPERMYYEDVIFTIDHWIARPEHIIVKNTGYYYRLHDLSTTATRHEEDKNRLFQLMRHRLKSIDTYFGKVLIIYTIIRLKLHFFLYD